MKKKLFTLATCIMQICSIILMLVPKTLIHEIWEQEGSTYTHKVFAAERNVPFTIFQTANQRVGCAIIVGVLLALAIFCATAYILQLSNVLADCEKITKKINTATIFQFLFVILFFFVVKKPIDSVPSAFQYIFVPQSAFYYLPILLLAIIVITIIKENNEEKKNPVVADSDS